MFPRRDTLKQPRIHRSAPSPSRHGGSAPPLVPCSREQMTYSPDDERKPEQDEEPGDSENGPAVTQQEIRLVLRPLPHRRRQQTQERADRRRHEHRIIEHTDDGYRIGDEIDGAQEIEDCEQEEHAHAPRCLRLLRRHEQHREIPPEKLQK